MYLTPKVANGCHTPDFNRWHWFVGDSFIYPPQITGNDPRLEPTANSISKGKSSTSWHFENSSSRFMISVFWEELYGCPVETKIFETVKKQKQK